MKSKAHDLPAIKEFWDKTWITLIDLHRVFICTHMKKRKENNYNQIDRRNICIHIPKLKWNYTLVSIIKNIKTHIYNNANRIL